MNYITFDKTQLINLEYSLSKEIIRSNRAGSFGCTTIINCNTRKYHGLLICPIANLNNKHHVLLSSLDETIEQRNHEFRLGIHKYPGQYNPLGHKYIRDFYSNPVPTVIYRVGGVVLKKETLFTSEEDSYMVRYTLLEAHSPTKIKLSPYLAFREIHALSKANMYANPKVEPVENGIRVRLYEEFPYLYMQTSKKSEFISAPDWYYNIEYQEEAKRGYDFHEDLMVPGFFEFSIKPNESIIFVASLKEETKNSLSKKFNHEIATRIPRESYEQCLQVAAQQFIVHRNNKTRIYAGFPWFVESWARDTFISLPGLTLPFNETDKFEAIVDTMLEDLRGGLFPNAGSGNEADVNSVDAPLWFFWALQQYVCHTGKYEAIYKKYKKQMLQILNKYKEGTYYNIHMAENGLIYAGIEGKALTWMDAISNGTPVTPRVGFAVEINALWYNAILFLLELADIAKDKEVISEWKDKISLIKNSFIQTFWSDTKYFLADFVNKEEKDWSVRPNQIFAVSMRYSPLNDDQKLSVLEIVQKELLTPRGLRTLSPKNPQYVGEYSGDPETRDAAYHQGTVWPWLLGHFCEAYLHIHGQTGLAFVKKLYYGFEEELSKNAMGTISEIYDGNPPHEAKGAFSQAWSVAELLRIKTMIDRLSKF